MHEKFYTFLYSNGYFKNGIDIEQLRREIIKNTSCAPDYVHSDAYKVEIKVFSDRSINDSEIFTVVENHIPKNLHLVHKMPMPKMIDDSKVILSMRDICAEVIICNPSPIIIMTLPGIKDIIDYVACEKGYFIGISIQFSVINNNNNIVMLKPGEGGTMFGNKDVAGSGIFRIHTIDKTHYNIYRMS